MEDGILPPEVAEVFKHKAPPYPYKVHERIKKTAEEFAGVFYEGSQRYSVPDIDWDSASVNKDYSSARTDFFREQFPTVEIYQSWMWPYFADDARRILAKLLKSKTLSEYDKQRIYDALLEDYNEIAFERDNVAALMAGEVREQRERRRLKAAIGVA